MSWTVVFVFERPEGVPTPRVQRDNSCMVLAALTSAKCVESVVASLGRFSRAPWPHRSEPEIEKAPCARLQYSWPSSLRLLTGCSPPAPTMSVRAASSSLGEPTASSPPCLYGQVKASRDSGIFQVPSGRFYSWTTGDMVCFDTAAVTLAAGFRPADQQR